MTREGAVALAIVIVLVLSASLREPVVRVSGSPEPPTSSGVPSGSAEFAQGVSVTPLATEPVIPERSLPPSVPPLVVTGRPMTSPPPRRASIRVVGSATWYRWRAGEAAAGPLLRKALGSHWRGRVVSVCAAGRFARCVRVRLTDWCFCSHGRRLVDLDARSFAKLGSLSAGVIAVTVKS